MTSVYKGLYKSCITFLLVFAAAAAIAQNDSVVVTSPQVQAGVDNGPKNFITGYIYDAASGSSVNGASVYLQGLYSSISDSAGSFSLRVPDYDEEVHIEAEGYQSVVVPLKGRTSIKVYLHEEPFTSFNDEMQLPLSKMPGTNVSYALKSIQTAGSWDRPTETPDNLLQGRVSGLNVIRRSGTPLQGANMFLRGYSSLYATNQPLVVVDGILYDANQMGPSSFSTFYANPISYIDPKDIDNITVIKDATSIYGTKGANGAILITTARAKELATRIDFSIYGGINVAPKNIPLMNATEYRTYLSDLLKTRGMTDAQIQSQPYMNDRISNPDYFIYHNNTDWQKQVFKNSATQNVFLKITGGDNIATYALSLGYLRDAGVIRETGLSRYDMRFNANLNLTKKLTAVTNLAYAFGDQTLKEMGLATEINPLFLALTKAPFLHSREVSSEGKVSPNFADTDVFGISNPAAAINSLKAVNKNYRFTGAFGMDYQFNKIWGLATNFGVNYGKVSENMFVPRKGIADDTLANAVASSRMYSRVNRLQTFYNDTRLNFAKNINSANNLKARLGFRYLKTNTESDYGLGYNSATDELISVGTGVNALRQVGGELGESKWMSIYANADYSFENRLFLSFNISGDGSSKFGKAVPYGLTLNNNKYAILPSVAAAWLISSEKFMSTINNVDLLKLRLSFGFTGNDDIGNYTARKYYVSQNLLGLQGTVRANIGNPELGWERNTKLNIGADLAMFNERLRFTIDAYQNTTKGMMIFEPTITASGNEFIATNSGDMQTYGADAEMNVRVVNAAKFKWDVGFNAGAFRSKITRLPGTIIQEYAGAYIMSRVNDPVTQFFGYKTNGVYTTDAQAAAEGLGRKMGDGSITYFRGGDIRFVDVNGDKLIDDNDRQVIGNANPDFFGGISTKFTYKRFSIDGLFIYVQGNDVYNYTRRALESQSAFANQTPAVINRWRADGQVTTIPRTMWGDPMGNASFSGRWIEDGSYLRLRNVSLTYNIPVKTRFIQNASVYAGGNNLITLTKYKGFDPEFSATPSVYTQGIDVAVEPQYRSVIFGVRIGL